MLPESDVRKIIDRLRLKNDLQKKLFSSKRIWKNKTNLMSLSPGEFTEVLENFPPLSLFTNWISTDNKEFKEKIEKFIGQWQLVSPNITGEDLKKHGIPQGPIYRSILQKIRVAWINGEIKTIEQENQFLKSILSKMS